VIGAKLRIANHGERQYIDYNIHSAYPNKHVPINITDSTITNIQGSFFTRNYSETNVTQTKDQDTILGLVIIDNIFNSS